MIGSGEPALPGVAIGHNERVGWGFTIVRYDAADLFIDQLDPEDPTRYRYGDDWLAMEVERDEIRVKGEAEPVEVEWKFTRHGPVIWEDPENDRVVALRWAGQEPGTAGYLGSLAMDRVENWDGFVEAMRRWKVPAENIVYADIDGDIGWIPAGLVPIRKSLEGPVPRPRLEARVPVGRASADVDELPRIHNPEQRLRGDRQPQRSCPTNYPHDLGFDWSAPYRFQRVDEVLGRRKGRSPSRTSKTLAARRDFPARARYSSAMLT